jgi:hypothetical protein
LKRSKTLVCGFAVSSEDKRGNRGINKPFQSCLEQQWTSEAYMRKLMVVVKKGARFEIFLSLGKRFKIVALG